MYVTTQFRPKLIYYKRNINYGSENHTLIIIAGLMLGSVVAGLVVSGKQENIPYLNIIYPCVTLVKKILS
jgi:hypothetical protein